MNGDNAAIDITTHDVESKALAVPDQARAIRIIDNAAMLQANAMLLDIKALVKEVDECFKPLAQKADEAHKAITGRWKLAKAPLIEAEGILKVGVKAYMDEVERKRREEEARLREIARKEEEERRLKEAELLANAGFHEEAEAVIDEPIVVVMPEVKADIPKVDMRNFRRAWKARVTDFSAFARYCASNPQYLHLLLPNDSGLNQMARALKNNMHLPGVQVTEE